MGDHLLADIDTHGVYHTQDVALSRVRVRAENKVRPSQGVEVYGVIGAVEGIVEHLADFLNNRSRLDVK